MGIKYKAGDLFQATEQVIAHGCNCQGGFGSGVAAGMAKHHPKAKKQYLAKFYGEDGWQLGDIQIVKSNDKWIVNCATQDHYMPRGVQHADYEAIEKCMRMVKELAQPSGMGIAIPKIGAGLAGGDWNVIEAILEKVFFDYDITVYYL